MDDKLLIIGINRIMYEANINLEAFYTIINNENINGKDKMPIALAVLLKNHFHVYISEISKLISEGGDSHFSIWRALKTLRHDITYTNKLRKIRKQLKAYDVVIKEIKRARNTLFAHLDSGYINYKNMLNTSSLLEFHEFMNSVIIFINSVHELEPYYDFGKMVNPNISDFYELVFKNVVNSENSQDLPKQEWLNPPRLH